MGHGTRNVYDLAIDPLMNIFSRGNTNDGGGWNIRFSHQIQSAEYGYPVLFKHFTEEIVPAMVDLGGGSGTGALYLDDDTWPDKYNKVPMMADWAQKGFFADLNGKMRLGIQAFGGEEAPLLVEDAKVDLEKIKNKKGQIGESSIEDVMLAMAEIKRILSPERAFSSNRGVMPAIVSKRESHLKGLLWDRSGPS